MTNSKKILHLTDKEKRKRIQELEAEIDLLSLSIQQPSLHVPSNSQPTPQKQTSTFAAITDVAVNASLIHSIPDMVYILNNDFDILVANQAFVQELEFSIDEIRGMSLLDLLPNFKKSDFYPIFKESMTDKQVREVVAPFDAGEPDPDDQHWYESRIFPVDSGILVIARDITLQREADAQILNYELARARMEMLDEIVQNLAHDFRTPLSTLQVSLYLLERYNDPEKQQQKLESIKQQVALLGKMIENIFLLTRLDFYQPTDLLQADIVEIIETAIQTLQAQADAKKQMLRLHVQNRPIYHLVNSSHLTRAISNIIENAIFYTLDGGEIDVIVEANEPSVQITVRDTGIGIEPEYLPHIFDRFYRVNQARTVNEAGNGLGLSIAKEIIELHDGTIDIVSNTSDGTEVTITL
jgi:signal transduction histidine kinase